MNLDVSIIIPVYNEEAGLASLFARLYPALDALGRSYEIIFINDGSKDRSAALLREQFAQRPDVTRVVLFNGNYGQHLAIIAGFEHSRGERIITLDADLQNPPEEIANLLAQMDAGHDYVGTIRRMRQDSVFRRYASRAMNRVRERITDIHMTDQGCMLRAYSRPIVNAINECREVNTFIPALAYTFAQNPVEIEVGHEERAAGETKYSLYKFNVNGIGTRAILSTKIRLYVTDESYFGGSFHKIPNNSWTENGVTWNNKPATDANSLFNFDAVSTGTWVEADLSSLVTTDNTTYGVMIKSNADDTARYGSRESATKPQLILGVQ